MFINVDAPIVTFMTVVAVDANAADRALATIGASTGSASLVRVAFAAGHGGHRRQQEHRDQPNGPAGSAAPAGHAEIGQCTSRDRGNAQHLPLSPPASDREHEVESLHELELQDVAYGRMQRTPPPPACPAVALMITSSLMSFMFAN